MSADITKATNHATTMTTTISATADSTSGDKYEPNSLHLDDTYKYIFHKHTTRICRILNIDENVHESKAFNHVKEQLGIVSHLVHIWSQLYTRPSKNKSDDVCDQGRKRVWKGFVDIGCGNGVVVDVLNKEGWSGWGFDARYQTSWARFDQDTQVLIEHMILRPMGRDVKKPIMFQSQTCGIDNDDDNEGQNQGLKASQTAHDGLFEKGTWIVSKHGDEITPWIPILATLSGCPFFAVPCCPYDLDGKEVYSLAPASFLLAKGVAGGRNKEKKHLVYVEYIENLCSKLGIRISREYLEIPGSRNLALVRVLEENDNLKAEDVGKYDGRENDCGVETNLDIVRSIVGDRLNPPSNIIQ